MARNFITQLMIYGAGKLPLLQVPLYTNVCTLSSGPGGAACCRGLTHVWIPINQRLPKHLPRNCWKFLQASEVWVSLLKMYYYYLLLFIIYLKIVVWGSRKVFTVPLPDAWLYMKAQCVIVGDACFVWSLILCSCCNDCLCTNEKSMIMIREVWNITNITEDNTLTE